ncbi:MAG TPA: 50S ribosomal protein L25/general stress protein Ctc [Aliicoccus persicus]|uniref:Large ribosomal subunit protein bL25 n=1 Tax=Aliicoccus persicus TaxID=930138 RepID=A0A921B5Z1_9STAP|nr:50S ribosomal protein L25/general stress protein Ctc [Aliicoccus persicus]
MAKLNAATRTHHSNRSELSEIRNNGGIPCVIYGYQTENTSVSVKENEFIKVIREVGRNGVIDLQTGEDAVKVMVSDYQFDAMKNQITHIDFLAINMNQEQTVDVSITLVGEAPGAGEGGVIEQPTFTVSVTAKPADIPETIEVDISEMNIGDTYYVSDVRSKGNFVIEDEDDVALVTCHVPAVEEEPEEGEEVDEADVPVIGEEDEESSEEETEKED